MGLLKHLLFWPVTGPLFLSEFSLGKIEGVVREELTDDTAIKAELMELQLKLELGDIDEDEFVEREARLMAQLREVRAWREQFGMGVSGGPVRVQPPREEQTVEPEAASAGADGDEPREPRVADPGAGADIEFNFDHD